MTRARKRTRAQFNAEQREEEKVEQDEVGKKEGEVAKPKINAQNQKPAIKARKRVRMNDGLFKHTQVESKNMGKAVLASEKLTATNTAAADISVDKTYHREKSAQNNDLSEENKTGGTHTEKRVEIAPFQYKGLENKNDSEA